MTIEAMKQALEALESGDGWRQSDAITALRTAIEQAEKQEPVVWVCYGGSDSEMHDIDFEQDEINALPIGTMLYTTPPAAPVQEPDWQARMTELQTVFKDVDQSGPLLGMGRPPAAQRQWVGLTDDVIERTYDRYGGDLKNCAYSLDRWLREKNA